MVVVGPARTLVRSKILIPRRGGGIPSERIGLAAV